VHSFILNNNLLKHKELQRGWAPLELITPFNPP
jgi:hypothetical protein